MLYLLLVICIAFSFNSFAQHYIGKDKIDQLNRKNTGYGAGANYKSPDNEVYLSAAYKKNGYNSDVLIGFDKLKYSRGETIILTFKRTGANAKVESEEILINGIGNVSGDGFELEKLREGGYHFTLKSGEIKRLFIKLRDKDQIVDGINIGIGNLIYSHESREYIIPYPPLPNDNNNNNQAPIIEKPDLSNVEIKKMMC